MRVQSGCGFGAGGLPFIVSTGGRWCRVQGLPVSCGVCSVPFSLPLSLCCFCFPAIPAKYALFRVLRAFLARFGGLVWVCLSWCFLWLVWVLCACGVRRIRGLWRVCLCFSSSLPLFYPFFIFFAYLLRLCLCCPLLVFFACLVCFCVLVGVVSFSLTDYTQKRKGAPCWCVLSCPVVCVQILVQLSKNSFAVYLAFSSSSGW